MAIHPIVVDILQFGPKWQTNISINSHEITVNFAGLQVCDCLLCSFTLIITPDKYKHLKFGNVQFLLSPPLVVCVLKLCFGLHLEF